LIIDAGLYIILDALVGSQPAAHEEVEHGADVQ
jgi:hypothetical protein